MSPTNGVWSCKLLQLWIMVEHSIFSTCWSSIVWALKDPFILLHFVLRMQSLLTPEETALIQCVTSSACSQASERTSCRAGDLLRRDLSAGKKKTVSNCICPVSIVENSVIYAAELSQGRQWEAETQKMWFSLSTRLMNFICGLGSGRLTKQTLVVAQDTTLLTFIQHY